MCDGIKRDFRQHGEDTDKYDGDNKQTHVPVTDMGKLMPDYGFKFFIVQLLDDTSRKGNRICAVIDTTCKCIQRIIMNDIYLRHTHALRHAEVFHQVVNAFVFLAVKRLGACGGINDSRISPIGDKKPDSHYS